MSVLRRMSRTVKDFSEFDRYCMQQALSCAQHAATAENEIPVGAVIAYQGEILARGWNRNIGLHDPTAHAEIMALRTACATLSNYRLPPGTSLYVTLEPCAMCATAMIHARIGRVVYAANDPKTGAAGSVFSLLQAPQHNHHPHVESGLLAEESAALLRTFFRERRQAKP